MSPFRYCLDLLTGPVGCRSDAVCSAGAIFPGGEGAAEPPASLQRVPAPLRPYVPQALWAAVPPGRLRAHQAPGPAVRRVPRRQGRYARFPTG